MIRINLLPQEQRPARWDFRRIVLMPILALIVVLGGIYSFGEYRIWQSERQLLELRARTESLRQAENNMKTSQIKQAQLVEKQKVLTSLTSGKKSWQTTITYLGSAMPPQIWLTDLLAEKGVLQMKGMSLSFPDLANFIRKLEQDERISDASVQKAEKPDSEPFTRFELSLRIKGM